MSDPKDFLSRWSRRKLESETEAGQETRPPENAGKDATAAPAKAVPEVEFDLSKLPSLESITANSDIRIFLQPGVPASLTHAALRRAWSADPAIRDFIGLSENSWDFNAPDSMPGFGSLNVEDARRIAARFFGELDEDAAGRSSPDRDSVEQSGPDAGESESPGNHEMRKADLAGDGTPAGDEAQEAKTPRDKDRRADLSSVGNPPESDGAAQHEEADGQTDAPLPPRRHGGAIPK
jgi:hypothetical protein